MQTFAEKAQFYRQLGWPVFPLHTILRHGTPNARCSCGDPHCGRPGKHPLIPSQHGGRGKDDATLDGDQIDVWSDLCPVANIAAPTGEAANIMVVDIDGEEGERSAEWLADAGFLLYDTTAATSGRGRHLYYRNIRKLRTATGQIAPGIDIRAEGGQIVLPPSLHISGRTYTWLRSPAELKPRVAPMWVPDLLEQYRQRKQKDAYREYDGQAKRERWGRRGDPMEIIDRYASRVAVLRAGCKVRNATLNIEAFNAFRDCKKYELDTRQVFDKMMAAAKACGLPMSEARGTIKSAQRGAYAKT
jgi:hypothetical protein